MGSQEFAIVAEGLRKRYGATVALDGLDLAVAEGTVCGLLGPNGAGKTTAVRILATLLRLDGGSARVAGFDVAREAAAVRRGCPAAVDMDGRRLTAPAGDPVAALSATLRALEDAGVTAEDVALRRPTLDEVFLQLTGRPAASSEEVAA